MITIKEKYLKLHLYSLEFDLVLLRAFSPHSRLSGAIGQLCSREHKNLNIFLPNSAARLQRILQAFEIIEQP